MEVGKKFKDIELYNSQMAKGMEDKLFFLDFLNPAQPCIFVDFGCADGTLINILHHIRNFATDKYIGYDISEQMIDLAKTKMAESPKNVMFTCEWKQVVSALAGYKKEFSGYKTVLILSSVIHEVYSYANSSKDIFDFWDKVLNTGFDYICVRDMMIPNDATETKSPEWIDNIQFGFQKFMTNERYKEFEEIWGPINFKETNKSELLHFFLKYRWQINWDREVHENYFPITIENFLQMFKEKYNLDYFERFCVPFIKDQIYKDFSIMLDDKDSTHVKAIFSAKTSNK